MGRLLKYLILGFLSGFALFFVAFAFFNPLDQAAVMAAVAGGVYALFCAGFMVNLMSTGTLQVTPSNKDPQKGMKWYEDSIRNQIVEMRFKKVAQSSGREAYHPTGFRRIWERRIELSWSAYDVRVKASKLMIRVLSDLVEIKPES